MAAGGCSPGRALFSGEGTYGRINGISPGFITNVPYSFLIWSSHAGLFVHPKHLNPTMQMQFADTNTEKRKEKEKKR